MSRSGLRRYDGRMEVNGPDRHTGSTTTFVFTGVLLYKSNMSCVSRPVQPLVSTSAAVGVPPGFTPLSAAGMS